jgi:DNA-binding GntR family transcriptional regulator
VSHLLDPDNDAPGVRTVALSFDSTPGGRPNHQSLKEMASDYIREGVVSGRLGPGAKVDQDQIADALGISRLPIREALIELTAKGFVESIPRRGAFVVKLTEQDIDDHFLVISLLFGLTARRAANQISAAQLRELQQLHSESTTTQDPSRRLALSFEFYRRINRIGTSDRLLLTLRFLALALPNDFYFNTSRWPATETVYRERVLAALENHDEDAAAKATEEHLRMAAKVTIEDLRARGYWSESSKVAEAAS